MNLETELAEVVTYLPRDAAIMLEFQPANRQSAILKCVRRVLVDLEQSEVVLDPISLGTVLTSLVRELLGLYMGLLNHLQDHGVDPARWENR